MLCCVVLCCVVLCCVVFNSRKITLNSVVKSVNLAALQFMSHIDQTEAQQLYWYIPQLAMLCFTSSAKCCSVNLRHTARCTGNQIEHTEAHTDDLNCRSISAIVYLIQRDGCLSIYKRTECLWL